MQLSGNERMHDHHWSSLTTGPNSLTCLRAWLSVAILSICIFQSILIIWQVSIYNLNVGLHIVMRFSPFMQYHH